MKVALLVNEFFTNELKRYNGFGGFGILARNYITEHLPNEQLEIDTIIGDNDQPIEEISILDNRKKVIFFPARPTGFNPKSIANWVSEKVNGAGNHWLQQYVSKLDYDLYLTLELQGVAYQILNASENTQVILWLQDPRPESDWEELDSMSVKQTGYRPTQKAKNLMRRLQDEKRLTVVTQGKYLADKGRQFYDLDEDLDIEFLPNPIQIDNSFRLKDTNKENAVIFLGRLDSVKRPWLYYAIAKQLPQYTFYVCGQSHEQDFETIKQENSDIPNLKFMGHVQGQEKIDLLKKSKVLVNTSIHEAIPVSFLEALSYGCLLVSCQNPDNLTSTFGQAIPQAWGDGQELVTPFAKGVSEIIEDDQKRHQKALEAIEYVSRVHSIDAFKENMQRIFKDAAKQ